MSSWLVPCTARSDIGTQLGSAKDMVELNRKAKALAQETAASGSCCEQGLPGSDRPCPPQVLAASSQESRKQLFMSGRGRVRLARYWIQQHRELDLAQCGRRNKRSPSLSFRFSIDFRSRSRFFGTRAAITVSGWPGTPRTVIKNLESPCSYAGATGSLPQSCRLLPCGKTRF